MKAHHQKHTALTRPDLGFLAKNEIAILGTPCSQIKELAYSLIKILSFKYKIAYTDADHKNNDTVEKELNSCLNSGASMEYTDKISFKRFDVKSEINDYYVKNYFSDYDLVLVNGNHFQAKKQILVIDSAKPLQKKLNKITDVLAIVFTTPYLEAPEYLQNHLPEYHSIPKFFWDDRSELVNNIINFLDDKTPEIKGLVLAGGKSVRMQRDKAVLNYHGKSQLQYTFDLLKSTCKEVFISSQKNQRPEIAEEFPVVEDTFTDLGPFGAILSAFREDPNAAWLVTACDLPYLEVETLQYLLKNRNPSKIATAFINPENNFPEPLVTIWEPKSYSKLLYFLSLGYSCPRKVLINSECELVEAQNPAALQNINLPEEYDEVLKKLKGTPPRKFE